MYFKIHKHLNRGQKKRKNNNKRHDLTRSSDITRSPAYQDDWNPEIEKQMMKAPNSTYAIIKSGRVFTDPLEERLVEKPNTYIEFMVVRAENGKLYGENFCEVPGWGVVTYGDGYGQFSTYRFENIRSLIKDDKISFQIPFNAFRKNPEQFRLFKPLQKFVPKISEPHASNDKETTLEPVQSMLTARKNM